MSNRAQAGAEGDEVVVDAGPSTDQHITGRPESGTFQTDRAPAADTPADGSSNAGINATRANRADDGEESELG